MFKVLSSEIKKMLSKPGIYVLAILLAIVLVLGVFIYKPSEENSSSITLTGNTFSAKYQEFYNSTDGVKKITDISVDESVTLVKNYYLDSPAGKITQEENINNAYNEFVAKYRDYRESSKNGATQEDINSRIKVNLVNALSNLNSKITAAILKSGEGSYSIITTETNYNNYTSINT